MTVYMVYEPPAKGGGSSLTRAERIAFVPDRFIWSAFLFTPLWMLWHRLWLVLAGYVGVVVALVTRWRCRGAGVGSGARDFAIMLLSLLIGFEAASLRRWTLALNGWREVGAVVGEDRESAERRFFDRYVSSQAQRKSAPAASVPPSFRPAGEAPGDDLEAAERRFFDAYVASKAQRRSAPPPSFRPAGEAPGVIGLFPQPGGTR